jgi:DSBA-like thioredoxin domain
VWRHLPLNDVHPHAQLAAEAAEAAASQGKFWQMHDLLLSHQGNLLTSDLIRFASDLGLDADRFRDHLRRHAGAARVAEDVDTADLSGVSGTPTFFINDRRHYGAYDIAALTTAVQTAKARVVSRKPQSPSASRRALQLVGLMRHVCALIRPLPRSGCGPQPGVRRWSLGRRPGQDADGGADARIGRQASMGEVMDPSRLPGRGEHPRRCRDHPQEQEPEHCLDAHPTRGGRAGAG